MTAPLVVFAHKGHDWIRGSEQCVLDLLSGLDRTRYRLLVVANGRALLRESERLGVRAVRVAHWGGGRILNAPWRHVMRGILRAHQPALIHANMAVALPLIIPASRKLAIPVVTHLHLSYDSLGPRHQALVRASDVIVGVAEHVVATLRADPETAARVRVIRNAVNVERLGHCGSADVRSELGIPRGAFVATSVGSLIDRKAHAVTIRAIGIARQRGLDVHLLLCGDGERESELRTLTETLGLGGSIHFMGVRRDVGAILERGSDVLVTSACEEALPLSMLEAQWLGVPVIASDIAAHKEMSRGVEWGLLAPCGDADTLAEALAVLARDPSRRAALGVAARLHARECYSMDRYVAEFDALYRELLVDGSAR
ncbi:MAG: glycosyltransferase family 4 protein [Gemmatimonadaceae bacterium]